MQSNFFERRHFLKKAGQTLLTAPIFLLSAAIARAEEFNLRPNPAHIKFTQTTSRNSFSTYATLAHSAMAQRRTPPPSS